MESILYDSRLNKLPDILKTNTFFSNTTCLSLIKKQIYFPSYSVIQKNQSIIDSFKKFNVEETNKMTELFDSISAIEKESSFFYENNNSLKSLEKDTFGQLIFQNDYFKQLNDIPFLLLFISMLKIYFIPVLSVFTPIFFYFVPYLMLKYLWKMPITYEVYQTIMGKMWSFDFTMNPQKIIQNLFAIFTLAQSIYQPIQNAFHLYTIDTNIRKLGSSILKFNSIVNEIKSILNIKKIYFNISSTLNNVINNDIRRNFINILEDTSRLLFVSKDISYLEILWKIANISDFKRVELFQSETPFLKANNIFDIELSKENRVGSNILISKDKNHFLLSGPNGGGKSSFLRGILQIILLSQTFGYSIGENIQMSPFDYIFSGLRIQDTPGDKSLFEKEICFARDILYHNNSKYKGFVVFDEIFHSTNPPDGIKTSNKFLEKLWSYNHVASIVSTHVFEIIESSPIFVQKICVSSKKENNKLIYDYSIKEGINKESSVEYIWKKMFNADTF